MKKRYVGVVLALMASGLGFVHASDAVHAQAVTGGKLDDPRLLGKRDEARREKAAHPERIAGPARVLVEVDTTDTDGVSRGLRRLGAEVNGSIPGAVVQALVPVDSLDAVAAFGAVNTLQYPQRQGYVPAEPVRRTDVLPQPQSLGSLGAAAQFTGADFWQGLGINGTGVKLGIVDYFSPTSWNSTENGPLPDANHQFCLDSFSSPGSINSLCTFTGQVQNVDLHGNAVAEIVKDVAPGVELFIASVGTPTDLRAAIDWFAFKGVTIMTRSLGSAYDGAGDGTGELGSVVNYAVAKGIVWFNSAGNDGEDAYLKKTVKATVAADGGNYVNFNDGSPAASPAVDTWLRIDSIDQCFFMDGVRWANDWYIPNAQRTDYTVEFWQPKASFVPGSATSHKNPTRAQVDPIHLNNIGFGNQGAGGLGGNIMDRAQQNGWAPYEAADIAVCADRASNTTNGTYVTYIRINRKATTGIGTVPDKMEVAIAGNALTEFQYSDRAGSAAKPVVDSKNPGLVSVGAVEVQPNLRITPSDATGIAWYSSQGPTTDGRVKPDVSSWSGFNSVAFGGSFSGTSAASPAAAGLAALFADAGMARGPAALAALVKHQTIEKAALGPDNAYGFGLTNLFDPPSLPLEAPTAGRYVPVTPQRIYDSRPKKGGPPAYSRAVGSIIDVPIVTVPVVDRSTIGAVAVNITSVGNRSTGFVQAYPTDRTAFGATSTLNLNAVNETVANFAIVPMGERGSISLYMPAGGYVIVDLMGYFTKNEALTDPPGGVIEPTDGRFVPLPTPVEVHKAVLSTGSAAGASVVFDPFDPAKVTTGLVPAGEASAAVIQLTASDANRSGFLRAAPSDVDAALLGPSNLNLAGTGAQATNTAIVPLGADGKIQIFSKAAGTVDVPLTVSTNVKVDVVGYITSTSALFTSQGLFMPWSPSRMYDSRKPSPNAIVGGAAARAVTVGGIPTIFSETGPPADAIAYSGNWTVTAPLAAGTLEIFTGTEPSPKTVNVSYPAGRTVATGALFAATFVPGTPDTTTVNAFMTATGHVIIDINGYFLAAPPP